MPSDQARPGWRKCSSIRSPHKIYLVRAIRNAIATAMATIWDAGTDPLGVVRIASDPHKKQRRHRSECRDAEFPDCTPHSPCGDTNGRGSLVHVLSAVNRERRAGHEVGVVCNEEQHATGDIFAPA